MKTIFEIVKEIKDFLKGEGLVLEGEKGEKFEDLLREYVNLMTSHLQ